MKTSQGFMTALLTLVALTFLSSSFAQETSPQFVVRIIYFIPNDREPRQNMDTQLVGLIQLAQEYFADLMENQGFSRKTFRVESDSAGKVVVHHVRGRFNDAYYQNPSSGSWIVWEEIEEQFDTSSNIYLLVLELSSENLIQAGGAGAAGIGTGNSLSGMALVTASDTIIAIHELGHAFGLHHDLRSEADFCYAEWLDVHRYFNTSQNAFNEDTSVQMLTPSLGVPPYGIHIRFEVTDADGLHQAQLFKPFGYPSVIACKKLNGKNTTVEFLTTQLIGGNWIVLRVMDLHGNFTEHSFPIDVTPLLPPPEVISVPDPNLAALVRETVGLAPLDPITQLAMLNLDNFHADGRQIENLAGIEYATNMYWLVLVENQIRDITSLAALTKLRVLFIVGNSISDISPLTGLMNLEQLFVWKNPLSYASIYTHIPALQARGVEVFFDNRTPQRIRIVSGNDQQGLPGAALKKPFVVEAQDERGVAFEGVPVTFTVTSGDGTLSTTSTATNTNGRAESFLTLGPSPGTNTVTVSVAGIPEGQTFNAVDIRVPKTLEIISGNDQEGLPGAALENPFVVEVRDRADTPVPGVQVTFSVTSGGGTLSVTSATTDKNGRAESILILGSNAGTNTVTVSVAWSQEEKTFSAEGIRIRDPNLRAAIATTLGKPPSAPFVRAHIPALTELYAPEANISDLTGLESATNLTSLTLHNNNISDISAVAGLTNLTFLSLWDNNISDISAVAGLTKLTSLNLGGNNISDISAVAGLTKLTSLNLGGNNISDISAVAGLTKLTSLNLGGNNISDISAVAGLTKLETLDLGDINISNIAVVAGLTNLTYLNLPDNNISDISVVAGLTKLTSLYLGNNNISDISVVAGLTNLTYLELAGNNISDISAVAGLTNLTYLHLWDNNISDISVVAGLTNLTFLNLWGNNISDISPLVENTGLGSGDEVYILGNPLSYSSIYTHIPVLQERGVEVFFDNRTPQRIRIVSGNDQQGLPGAALEKPLIVEVRDQSGDPLPGVQVAFSVSIGGGMLSATSATTDVNGRAESILTLGPNPGANTVEVGVTGIQEKQSVSAIAELPPIPQDVNGDDVVNILDLVLVASVSRG